MKNIDDSYVNPGDLDGSFGSSARVFMNATRKRTAEMSRRFAAFIDAAKSDIETGASTGDIVVIRDAAREFRRAYMHLAYAVEQEAPPDELREWYDHMVGTVEMAMSEVSDNAVEGGHLLAVSAYNDLREAGNQAIAARESMFRERGKRRRAGMN